MIVMRIDVVGDRGHERVQRPELDVVTQPGRPRTLSARVLTLTSPSELHF